MQIILGSDHGGLELKSFLTAYINKHYPSYTVFDLGTYTSQSVDYPDIAKEVAQKVLEQPNNLGVLVCGTGIGVSIAANRFKGIRAALVHDAFTAKMAKRHNNANIICFGGRLITKELASQLLDIWLTERFEGERHLIRLAKLDQ